MLVHYYVNNKLIDKVEIACSQLDSCAFFCPVCGEVWGRIHATENDKYWHSVAASCERHPASRYSYYKVPGSFIEDDFPFATDNRSAFWAQTINYMPKRILERELLLLIKEIDHEPEVQQESPDEILQQLCSA